MNEKLDKQLCEKYPKIFVNRNGDMKETCMYWGFSCGDGWYDLIDTLCGTVQNYIDSNSSETRVIPQLVAEQVKEKFGTLRFYTSGGDTLIDGMIWFAESMSSRICESCGKPATERNLRDHGWIVTLCDEHQTERENRFNE
jgi:hypothetical protein